MTSFLTSFEIACLMGDIANRIETDLDHPTSSSSPLELACQKIREGSTKYILERRKEDDSTEKIFVDKANVLL